jgi:outer membrane protein assembly factor BamB
VLVRNDSEGVLLTDSDGTIVSWGRDPDADTGYQAVGQSIVRVDAHESSLSLEGYTAEGKSLWKITADSYWIKAGQLFVADKAEDGSYSMLQRIDLVTGKDMWTGEGESGSFKGLTGVVGDHVVLQNFVAAGGDGNATSDAVFVLDLASGKKQVTQTVGEIARTYLGSSQFYVHSSDSRLSAYAYADGTQVWDFEMGENGGVILLGSYLAYADLADGILYGLAVK